MSNSPKRYPEVWSCRCMFGLCCHNFLAEPDLPAGSCTQANGDVFLQLCFLSSNLWLLLHSLWNLHSHLCTHLCKKWIFNFTPMSCNTLKKDEALLCWLLHWLSSLSFMYRSGRGCLCIHLCRNASKHKPGWCADCFSLGLSMNKKASVHTQLRRGRECSWSPAACVRLASGIRAGPVR